MEGLLSTGPTQSSFSTDSIKWVLRQVMIVQFVFVRLVERFFAVLVLEPHANKSIVKSAGQLSFKVP